MGIIEVNHVTKEYQLGQIQSLKTAALNQWRRLTGQPVEERAPFKALDDINFSVEQGEVLGIIGHNGAGKSTMLKLLANISKPSSGSITVKGKVAPLIEVGAGLVGDLTGRENIYLNGAILGITKAEINSKFDGIVAFAELEEFIDTPIKRYSSGMQVRLGFSIATSVEADILIVDEVLAVGDMAFQRKCFDRMEDIIKRQGKTVLLVSHNMRQIVRLCSRAILLDHGHLTAEGLSGDVCERFFRESNTKIAANVAEMANNNSNVRSSGEVALVALELLSEDTTPLDMVTMGAPVIIRATFQSNHEVTSPEFVFGVHTTDFVYIASMGTAHIADRPALQLGVNVVDCRIESLALMPGVYFLRVSIMDRYRREIYYAEMLHPFTVVSGRNSHLPGLGFVHFPAVWAFHSDRTLEAKSVGIDFNVADRTLLQQQTYE